jgi:type IV secretory pathway VirB6-like protein
MTSLELGLVMAGVITMIAVITNLVNAIADYRLVRKMDVNGDIFGAVKDAVRNACVLAVAWTFLTLTTIILAITPPRPDQPKFVWNVSVIAISLGIVYVVLMYGAMADYFSRKVAIKAHKRSGESLEAVLLRAKFQARRADDPPLPITLDPYSQDPMP